MVSAQSAAQKAVDAAKKMCNGKTITIVWEAGLQSLDPKNFSGPMWEKLTSCKINVVEVPTAEMFTKIMQEFRAGTGAYDALNLGAHVGDAPASVAANRAALAQALGLSELEAVATEHWVGDFKLDILCTDGDQQVVIENQLAETDHRHLGQILAYAAGVDARKVIWVAESFRPEHVAALQFLNDNTTDDLSFFGVQIELWRIGDSLLAPKFEVVVKPNDWARAGREQARAAASASPTKQLQLKFLDRDQIKIIHQTFHQAQERLISFLDHHLKLYQVLFFHP
jgi:hypothetical protein